MKNQFGSKTYRQNWIEDLTRKIANCDAEIAGSENDRIRVLWTSQRSQLIAKRSELLKQEATS